MNSTFYKYNVQGKMVEVTQGTQKRFFMYDSLGRLIRVRQPEQETNAALELNDVSTGNKDWTAKFTYDLFGNVLTTIDAKGTTITNTYDKANRVKTRTYTNEPAGQTTPAVSYFYDGKGLATAPPTTNNYAKGKLTKVTSSISETRYTQFDSLGRLLQSQQITDGRTFTSGYLYDFAGRLVEETYPSGRVVKNSFEADGDLLKVESQRAGTTLMKPYVSNFSYTAAGGISQMRLGNGRWETAKFNDRLQVTELGLGASATDASLWKVAYGYGELNTDGTVNQTKNTGNIAKQTISFNGLAQPFVQTFRYDSLYRITEAKEANGTATIANWQQNWSYDRYGNRLAFAQNINGVTNNLTPSIDTNTNRFTSGQGFVYDKNGNITADVDYNETRSFVFNGDNKQVEILKNGNIIGRYFYDGEGKRVKKVTDSETTIFVYSSGKLVAEYSTKLADNPSTNYTTTDHLGSPRVITNELGQIKSRRDFLPFGEDLAPNANNRTAALKYNTDEVRQKFTGYQKDNETGLDFAEARMYNNAHGRFTAVDPLMASGKSVNPQTFNRYVYVTNSPLINTDPTGLCKERECPKNYFGAVYTATVNGEVRYSNVQHDNSWAVFTGNDSFVRVGGSAETIYSQFGWYEAATPIGRDSIRDLLGGFREGYNDTMTGAGRGAANVGIGALNFASQPGGIYGTALGVPNPLAVEPYQYDSLRQARVGTAIEACAILCGGVAAAPFRAGSMSSVVPKGSLNIFATNPSASEVRSAIYMKDKGFDVILRDPVGTRAGGGTSDLLVDGIRYDVYTPKTGNPDRVIGAIRSKNSQANGIVLDLYKTQPPLYKNQLGNVLDRVRRAGANNINDIQIIGGN